MLENIHSRQKTFSTVVAVVQGLQRRQYFVLTELQAKAEAASAPVAVERKLSRVLHSEVAPQSLGNGKALSALEATVRLDTSVDEEVPKEDGRTGGRVQTQRTEVAFFLVTIQLLDRRRRQLEAAVHSGLGGTEASDLFPGCPKKSVLVAELV